MSKDSNKPSQYRKYKPLVFSGNFSDEEMARDWTLSQSDIKEVQRFRKNARLYIAIQICCVRLYGRFIQRVGDLSVTIIHYLNKQLGMPTQLDPDISTRKATYAHYHKAILSYLGFQKFNPTAEQGLKVWLGQKVKQGYLPDDLFLQAQHYLLTQKTLLPGSSVLGRLIGQISNEVHLNIFRELYQKLPSSILEAIEGVLKLPEGEQRTFFFELKEYPPSASISTLKNYLAKYDHLMKTGIDQMKGQLIEPAFQEYLYTLAKKYSAKDLKRFDDHKRYALMICFLIESRKQVLDYLVALHDQFILDMVRKAKNTYEKQYRKRRHEHKKSMNNLLVSVASLLDWLSNPDAPKQSLAQQLDAGRLQSDYEILSTFNQFTSKGYGHFLLTRYPSLRKYFRSYRLKR